MGKYNAHPFIVFPFKILFGFDNLGVSEFCEICSKTCFKSNRGVVPIGRTAVSKTDGWGFESLRPCHFRQV